MLAVPEGSELNEGKKHIEIGEKTAQSTCTLSAINTHFIRRYIQKLNYQPN